MPIFGQGAGEQGLGAAVERLAVQDHVARPGEGEQGRGDGRHAGTEQERGLAALVDGQPVLDDLAVGVVEARVDEAGAALRGLLAPGDHVEVVAPLLGGAEHEGGGQEHRRLDRALGQRRVVAVSQHQRLGPQAVVADGGVAAAVLGHRGGSLKRNGPEERRWHTFGALCRRIAPAAFVRVRASWPAWPPGHRWQAPGPNGRGNGGDGPRALRPRGGGGAAGAHPPGLPPVPRLRPRQAVQRAQRRPDEPDAARLRRRRARGALATALSG